MANIPQIKHDFKRVIEFSQGISDPKLDKLFSMWLEAKRDFIEVFGGKLIYEYPEKISFTLGPKEKHERVLQFSAFVNNMYGYDDLARFIEVQESGFFDNITTTDYVAWDGKTIHKGTKLVRAFKHFISDAHSLTDIQNEASRIIQEDRIEGVLCFSVHPLDFLSLSENTYNWRSCHALDGEYRAGNLSYMMDNSTIICYLKAENNTKLPSFPLDVPWNSKKWRVLFHFTDDWRFVFAGRQYPFEASAGMDFVLRKALPKAGLCKSSDRRHRWSDWNNFLIDNVELSNGINHTFDTPYLFNGSGLVPITNMVVDARGSKHYNDVLHSSCYKPIYSFRYIEGCWGPGYVENINTSKALVGAMTYCLKCGETEAMTGADTMMCEQCELEYGTTDNDMFTYCDSCGRRIFTDDSYWVQDEYLCSNCYDKYTIRCDCCEETFFTENVHYHEDMQRYLCDDCYEDLKEGKNG